MIISATVKIYAAIREPSDRSKIENLLVLDGFEVSVFAAADDLWDVFKNRPARVVISDRQFPGLMSGVDLTRRIREHHKLPYTYIVLQSVMNRLSDIEEGIDAGADDYLIKPHHPFELRARLLVALRWVQYIDSLTTVRLKTPVNRADRWGRGSWPVAVIEKAPVEWAFSRKV